MISICKRIRTETGHRLTSYSKKCAHLHGHSMLWEVSVSAPDLDEVGFIMDFSDLKKVLKRTVDKIDHAFLMHDQDPIVLALGEYETVEFLRATNGDTPRLFILPFNPTSENMIEWMAYRIMDELPEGITLTSIKLWETAESFTLWEE